MLWVEDNQDNNKMKMFMTGLEINEWLYYVVFDTYTWLGFPPEKVAEALDKIPYVRKAVIKEEK